uniref:Secreted protein n=1 Tax=Arundo donax TaxID=35708 RepID=A0A0A9CR41_ARUDO
MSPCFGPACVWACVEQCGAWWLVARRGLWLAGRRMAGTVRRGLHQASRNVNGGEAEVPILWPISSSSLGKPLAAGCFEADTGVPPSVGTLGPASPLSVIDHHEEHRVLELHHPGGHRSSSVCKTGGRAFSLTWCAEAQHEDLPRW